MASKGEWCVRQEAGCSGWDGTLWAVFGDPRRVMGRRVPPLDACLKRPCRALDRAQGAEVPSPVSCQSRMDHLSGWSMPRSDPVAQRGRGKGQTRLRTLRGAPPWGQVPGVGVVAVLRGGSRVAPVCEVIIGRMVSVVRRQAACLKPQCRTVMKPAGRTGWRKRRLNSRTSRHGGRGRALPGVR
jgi:hypothetical protein